MSAAASSLEICSTTRVIRLCASPASLPRNTATWRPSPCCSDWPRRAPNLCPPPRMRCDSYRGCELNQGGACPRPYPRRCKVYINAGRETPIGTSGDTAAIPGAGSMGNILLPRAEYAAALALHDTPRWQQAGGYEESRPAQPGGAFVCCRALSPLARRTASTGDRPRRFWRKLYCARVKRGNGLHRGYLRNRGGADSGNGTALSVLE